MSNRLFDFSEKVKKEVYKKYKGICTICLCVLVMETDAKKRWKNSFISLFNFKYCEIAHIIPSSNKEGEPRSEYKDDFIIRYGEDKLNKEENAVLLCKNCHKNIDSINPEKFPMDKLIELKERHSVRYAVHTEKMWIENQEIIYELISKIDQDIFEDKINYKTIEYKEKMDINSFHEDDKIFINIQIRNLMTNDYKIYRDFLKKSNVEFEDIRNFLNQNYLLLKQENFDLKLSDRNIKIIKELRNLLSNLLLKETTEKETIIVYKNANINLENIEYFILKIIWIMFVECDIFEKEIQDQFAFT
ncbi:HNH endonuclease signature motif containing protein [Spiroplasma floricola]|uniref:HNH nuclease domain-containing protein n=1 Tax=Spiroplasma floricola 23-6 TaxID=1336749 RepID=A0A2K8SEP2_9MOLU|nr:HNH endonuclease signature motif containing protein [Spiroplasma floricola]AUB31728.1 hypothetical protein SFLOR_v1c06800 [Spiroplasma floricola 23-6]